ncbi:MAG: hypothetical protein ACREJU_03995 [Nitrospiraceae bacterium]
MRVLLSRLFVLLSFSLAVAGFFPTDDETPQPTVPPLLVPFANR